MKKILRLVYGKKNKESLNGKASYLKPIEKGSKCPDKKHEDFRPGGCMVYFVKHYLNAIYDETVAIACYTRSNRVSLYIMEFHTYRSHAEILHGL